MFLEICPFGTLRDRMKSRMTQLEVLRLFRELVEGMNYMHAQSTILAIL